MSEQGWMVLGTVAGLTVLCVAALGALALLLGRPLRAQGRARFGEHQEFAVAVEVPEAKPTQKRAERALPSPDAPGPR